EVIGAGNEIALTIDLDQDADLPAGVDVLRDGALAGDTGRLFLRDRCAAFAEDDDRLLDISDSFGQRLLAVHHWSAGEITEFLHLARRNRLLVVVWFWTYGGCHNRR